MLYLETKMIKIPESSTSCHFYQVYLFMHAKKFIKQKSVEKKKKKSLKGYKCSSEGVNHEWLQKVKALPPPDRPPSGLYPSEPPPPILNRSESSNDPPPPPPGGGFTAGLSGLGLGSVDTETNLHQ